MSAFARDGDQLYVGGAFTVASAVAAAGVARWSLTGESWQALGGGVTWSTGSGRAQARALAVARGDLYVGGDFDRAGGSPAAGIARWSSGGWSAVGSGLGGAPYQPGGGVAPDPAAGALVAVGSTLYAFGGFSTAGGVATGGGARWSLPDGPWSATGGAPAATVSTVAVAVGSRIAVGGLRFVDGRVASLAVYDTVNGRWSFVPTPGEGGAGLGVANTVLALASGADGLLVGGWFDSAGGRVAHRIGLLTTALTWRSLGETRGGADFDLEHVAAMATVDDRVVVGGDFRGVGAQWATQQSGVAANALAQYDRTEQRWLPLPSPPSRLGVVRALAVADGALFVGVDGQVWRRPFASSTWTLLGETDGLVFALAARGDDLFVGGQFGQVAGTGHSVSAANVARYQLSADRWLPFGAGARGATGGSAVRAIAVADDDVYFGGSFAQIGPIAAANIARYHPATDRWTALGPGVTGGVGRALPVVNAIVTT
ncbi:MAG: hypothetical protein NZ518_08995, partial [Dehalococcoidia bacterium]|nr:hypothetical protein [Dehalococcoidia bacterium]